MSASAIREYATARRSAAARYSGRENGAQLGMMARSVARVPRSKARVTNAWPNARYAASAATTTATSSETTVQNRR